jgi:predicted membrane protein
MGRKKQLQRFNIVLYASALVLFIIELVTKLWILTAIGWVFLISSIIIQYYFLPKLKKDKKEKRIMLEEVRASEIAKSKITLSEYIDKYWDKFIVWLHT